MGVGVAAIVTALARPATTGQWCDTDWPLTARTAEALRAAGYLGVGRYVPLPDNPSAGDVTSSELAAILAAGLQALLVQHVRRPGWRPREHDGAADARAAVLAAQAAGYPAGAHLFADAEGMASDTVPDEAWAYAVAWAAAVVAAGYRAGLYAGYAVPLSPEQLYALPGVDCYWHGGGGVAVASRGVAVVQGPGAVVAGVQVDEDTVALDALGGLPFAAAAVVLTGPTSLA